MLISGLNKLKLMRVLCPLSSSQKLWNCVQVIFYIHHFIPSIPHKIKTYKLLAFIHYSLSLLENYFTLNSCFKERLCVEVDTNQEEGIKIQTLPFMSIFLGSMGGKEETKHYSKHFLFDKQIKVLKFKINKMKWAPPFVW